MPGADESIQGRLNAHLVALIPISMFLAGVLYGFISILELLSEDYGETRFNTLTHLNLFTAVTCFVLFFQFRKHPVRKELSHPVLTFVLLLVAFNTLLRLYWFPQYSLGIIFCLLATSLLMNSIIWFVAVESIILTASASIIYLSFDDPHLVSDSAPLLFIGAINSILIFSLRRQSLIKMETTNLALENRNQAFQETNSQLEKAMQEKSRLLSSMSHELRTPLNAIIGFCDLLLMDEDEQITNRKRIEYLTTINHSGHHLLSLIQDLLEIGAVNKGSIKLDRKIVLLEDILSESMSMSYHELTAKGLHIDCDLPENLLVTVDRIRTRQVLLNLISNAIRFSPTNSRILIQAIPEPSGMVTISIQDKGLGIPSEDSKEVFSEFYKTNETIGSPDNSGIGLSLCKRLVESHGGDIWIDQGVGEGTRICFTLPVGESSREYEAVSDPLQGDGTKLTSLGSLKILVAEDNAVNMSLVREVFLAKDHTIFEAANGSIALDLAQRLQPDLILMDIEMPVMDGHEAIRLLKQNSITSHIPVIALTAHADTRIINKCLQAGCLEVISKPINIVHLEESVERVISSLARLSEKAQ